MGYDYNFNWIIWIIVIIVVITIIDYRSSLQQEKRQRTTWKNFAKTYNLNFFPGNYFNNIIRASGLYRGYSVNLFISRYISKFSRSAKRFVRTHANLAFNQQKSLSSKSPLSIPPPIKWRKGEVETEEDLIEQLIPAGLVCSSKKDFKITVTGHGIHYVHDGFEGSRQFLVDLTKMLCDIADNIPHVIALGGEVVSVLQAIVDNKTHPLFSVARYLLQEIALQSQDLKATYPKLLCPHCLRQYKSQPIKLPRRLDITYYACPECYHNRDYFAGDVVIVLNNQREIGPLEVKGTLRVNWLVYGKLFDFDSIFIEQATDEEVERLAVQIGNGTDPSRKAQYKEMRCIISTDCTILQSTIRLLAEVVGNVEMEES